MEEKQSLFTDKFPDIKIEKDKPEVKKSSKKQKIILLVIVLIVSFTFYGLAIGTSVSASKKSESGATSGQSDSHSLDGTLSTASATNIYISAPGQIKYYSFVPTTSGDYNFYSESTGDTFALLYDADWNELENDDDSGTDRNFRITYNLTKGKTYYLGVKTLLNANSVNARLYVSR